MILTCSRVGCGVEFEANQRHARPYCTAACSVLAHKKPPLRCACGKVLVRYQRVACSPQCAGQLRADSGCGMGIGGGGHPLHTRDTKSIARAMWVDHPELSAREIGRRMRPQMSKNSIIGMAHRNLWPARQSPIRGFVPGVSRPRTVRVGVVGPSGQRSALAAGAVSLPALASAAPVVAAARKAPPTPPQRAPEPRQKLPVGGRQCEWLSGDKPFVRCSEGAEQGYSYCAVHCRVAYIGWRRDRQALACVAA